MISFRMACGSMGPGRFLARVVDLERQNRQPVDDEPGGFGLQGRLRVGQFPLAKPFQQYPIEVFGKIIAQLIGGVDAPLDSGEVGIARTGGPRFVFNVPEIEVGAMLAGDEGKRIIVAGAAEAFFPVPPGGEMVVKLGHLLRREHRFNQPPWMIQDGRTETGA